MPKPGYSGTHVRAREQLLASDPLCIHCGDEVATVADHQPPLSQHVHQEGTGCCERVPSCRPCSDKQGGELGGGAKRAPVEVIAELDEPDPTPGRDDPSWQVPWLVELVDTMPDDAVWPRYMSAPHPDAVGSFGEEFITYCELRTGGTVDWWQRLCVTRILEHDDAEFLCWDQWFKTVARQVGKSWVVRELFVWFTAYTKRLVPRADANMLASRRVQSAEKLIIPVNKWADDNPNWKPTKAVGRMSVQYLPDDVTWFVKSADMAYGETLGLGVMDECWDIRESDFTEGMEPTVMDSEGQIGFTSTAHRRATSLSLNIRQEAFRQIDEGPDGEEDVLIIEWSTPRTYALDDEDGWRLACPRWTPKRRKRMRGILRKAREGISVDETEPDPLVSFETQYLNRWPQVITRKGKGEPLLQPGEWASTLITSEVPEFGKVVALEDNLGEGCAVVVAGLTRSERIAVTGKLFDSIKLAVGWMNEQTEVVGYLVGASLDGDPRLRNLNGSVKLRGSQEIRTDVPRFRQLVKHGTLVHDGTPDLADQVLEARTRATQAGVSLIIGPRLDLVRAAVWCCAEVENRQARTPQVW